jgi:DNA-binding transcriptional LysR family regulator
MSCVVLDRGHARDVCLCMLGTLSFEGRVAMNIQQLESFLWVARLGSVTRACERLSVTQSTISMRLKALETDLGVLLFDRAHKRLKLTTKGRSLVHHAERIVEAAHEAKLEIADAASQTGTICLGVAELVALTWGPDFIEAIMQRFPNLTLELDVGAPLPLAEGLSTGALDLVLAPMPLGHDASIVALPLGYATFIWVANPSLKFDDRLLTPRDFEQLPIIGVAGNQSVIYRSILQWFADHGVGVRRHSSCNSLTTATSLVARGLGIGLLPEAYCQPFIERGELRVLRTRRSFQLNFFARHSETGDQVLTRQLVQMAQVSSTFPVLQAPRR